MAKNNKKVEDYTSLDNQALQDKIASEASQLQRLQFSHAISPIENPMQIRQLRRNIARYKTELQKRTLG